MSKNPYFAEDIKKILNKQSLYGKEIKEKLLKIYKDSEKTVRNTTVNETLINLISKNEIQVEGYNPKFDERKRKQSFKTDGILFSLIKKDPTEIWNLLSELHNQGNIDAKRELKTIFNARIESINNKKRRLWEISKTNLQIRKLNDKELMWMEANRLMLHNNVKSDEAKPLLLFNQTEYSNWINFYLEKAEKRLPKLHEQYKHLKIRYTYGQEPKMPIENPKTADEFLKFNIIYDTEDKKQIIKYQIYEQGLEGLPDKLANVYIVYRSPISNDKFLEKELGYSKPVIMTTDEIEDLFENTLSYIKSQDKGQNRLLAELAEGLSARKVADEKLSHLISKVQYKSKKHFN